MALPKNAKDPPHRPLDADNADKLRRPIWRAGAAWSVALLIVGFPVRTRIAATYDFMLGVYEDVPHMTRWLGLPVLGVTQSLNPAPGLASLLSGVVAAVPLVLAAWTCRPGMSLWRVRL